jgi:hypothetical protein
MTSRLPLALLCVLAAAPALAQKKNDGELPPRTEADILKTVTLPEGLLHSFTAPDLANLLAWLESLKR